MSQLKSRTLSKKYVTSKVMYHSWIMGHTWKEYATVGKMCHREKIVTVGKMDCTSNIFYGLKKWATIKRKVTIGNMGHT